MRTAHTASPADAVAAMMGAIGVSYADLTPDAFNQMTLTVDTDPRVVVRALEQIMEGKRTLAERRRDRERVWTGFGTRAGRLRRERPAWQRGTAPPKLHGGAYSRIMPALQDPRVRGQLATRPL